MNNVKGVAVYNYEQLGKEILYSLAMKKIVLHHESYMGTLDNEDFSERFGNQFVDIVQPTKFGDIDVIENLKNSVSCIIVTSKGPILEKEIGFLLSLDIPLIIYSKGYNKELLLNKINLNYEPMKYIGSKKNKEYHENSNGSVIPVFTIPILLSETIDIDQLSNHIEFIQDKEPGIYFNCY